MRDTYGRADGGVLVGIERAAHTGRRITGRRARRQKRARNSNQGWTIGSLTVTPVVGIVVALFLIASAAGAAVALGGKHDARKMVDRATPVSRVSAAAPSSKPAAPSVKGIYVRFADTAGRFHYMYCTQAAGCGVLDVAKDGTSKIAVASVAGVWQKEQRTVLKHDPCINIVQNAEPIGKPGDFVMVRTTNLRREGTQVIKGISAPARIVGDFAVRFEYPDVPNCTFENGDSTQHVDSPVTEYVPKPR